MVSFDGVLRCQAIPTSAIVAGPGIRAQRRAQSAKHRGKPSAFNSSDLDFDLDCDLDLDLGLDLDLDLDLDLTHSI